MIIPVRPLSDTGIMHGNAKDHRSREKKVFHGANRCVALTALLPGTYVLAMAWQALLLLLDSDLLLPFAAGSSVAFSAHALHCTPAQVPSCAPRNHARRQLISVLPNICRGSFPFSPRRSNKKRSCRSRSQPWQELHL